MLVRSKVKNRPKQSNNTALGVMENKKVCVWALGRGTLLKSKLHSPSQTDYNWKPINAFPTCLGRQMEVVHSICTQIGPKHQDFCMGIWNFTSLMEKNRNWFGRQSSIILILLESPLPSFMVLIPLS